MAKRRNTQFVVVRNGEHVDEQPTMEAAARVIVANQEEDKRHYEAGWTNANPDRISYYILPR